jgi:hypothetical protein
MTTTLEQLTKRIEELMREHVAGVQLAAVEAVARAVARENRMRRGGPTTPRSAASRPHRSESEIAALSERLYEAVCKKPGELMAVFAAELNSSANELQMPMRRLRSDDRVRSIGARHQTRYFPL